nr:CU044_2847 family protein [Kibdelosporangium phytohabitans]
MPSGEAIWVHSAEDRRGPRDVSLRDNAVAILQLPGLVETVQGVLSTVKSAVAKHKPDSLAVEFGLEINAKTGKVLSVLAEAGGKTHIKITATWGSPQPPPAVDNQVENSAPAEAG